MRLLRAGTGFRRRHPPPPALTDHELRQVTAPTLALLGEGSQMYDARSVATQIRAQIAGAHAETIPDAGHDLPVRCPDLVSDGIIHFAAVTEARA
jgi:pimeloyl-ACP methyl ester carboxylesterase